MGVYTKCTDPQSSISAFKRKLKMKLKNIQQKKKKKKNAGCVREEKKNEQMKRLRGFYSFFNKDPPCKYLNSRVKSIPLFFLLHQNRKQPQNLRFYPKTSAKKKKKPNEDSVPVFIKNDKKSVYC